MLIPILLDVNMTNVSVSVYIKSLFSVRLPTGSGFHFKIFQVPEPGTRPAPIPDQEVISFVAELR